MPRCPLYNLEIKLNCTLGCRRMFKVQIMVAVTTRSQRTKPVSLTRSSTRRRSSIIFGNLRTIYLSKHDHIFIFFSFVKRKYLQVERLGRISWSQPQHWAPFVIGIQWLFLALRWSGRPQMPSCSYGKSPNVSLKSLLVLVAMYLSQFCWCALKIQANHALFHFVTNFALVL